MNIPNNALLSSADAVSMYTNIDTQQAINSMQDFIQVNLDKIPSNFPTTLFLNILEIVMNNNIFSFGDTFWLQLTCTAMGMPAACSYATITFGQHENIHLLPEYRAIYYIISIISMISLACGFHLKQITATPGIKSKTILIAG
jgi:hypothetical protein